MARDDSDTDKSSAADTALDGKIKTNRVLLFVAVGLTVVGLSVVLTGLIVMFLRLAELKPPSDEQIDQRYLTMQSQLEQLTEFRNIELKTILELQQKLDEFKNDDKQARLATMKKLLIEREQDFQVLIETVRSGTESLARMNRGDRQWLEAHTKELDQLLSQSQLRASGLANDTATSDTSADADAGGDNER